MKPTALYRRITKKALNALFSILVLIVTTSLVPFPTTPQQAGETAYVEDGLLSRTAETLSVIVTAQDSKAAAKAVQQMGGQVASDLWLIDAVAATMPTAQLAALAKIDGVRSIVDNKGVSSAHGPSCSGDFDGLGPCAGEDGYVSEMRVRIADIDLNGNQTAPAVALLDGAIYSQADNGQFMIIEPDGAIRASGNLPETGYVTAPVVDASGTIFVASADSKWIHAIHPDGQVLWSYQGTGQFLGGVTLGPDGVVYAATLGTRLYGFDPSNGEVLLNNRINNDDLTVVAPIAIGADGTIYMVTNQDDGYLFAIDPLSGIPDWNYPLNEDDNLWKLAPQIGDDGTIYIAGSDGCIHAVNPDGSRRFRNCQSSKFKANPAIASDGRVFAPGENSVLYALHPNGALDYFVVVLTGDYIRTSPLLSPDENSIYFTVEGKPLIALNTSDGSEQWNHMMDGNIKSAPVFDNEGNIVLGSEGKDMVFLHTDGEVLHSEVAGGKLQQSPLVTPDGLIAFRVDSNKLTLRSRLPTSWDGRADVIATSDPEVYKFVNPYNVDIGIDQLQDTLLPPNDDPITGLGVTIALLDSGVYFDQDVRGVFGSEINQRFLGQVDFVRDGSCVGGGVQQSGYCEYDYDESKDKYGHGTHIAGIIWNNYRDFGTGLRMGVAPDANIISIRILDEQGKGSYADVIEGLQFAVANKDTYQIKVINMSLSARATTPYFVDPINRATEAAWLAGITVLAAAGNTGPGAETITVPGNDPYIITVGAVNSNRTPGYWNDDFVPTWSSTGPTQDGVIKPDILAPGSQIVSFIYNDPLNLPDTAELALIHPDYSENTSLFRMNGTSMATGVASGVVALMLQADPSLTPDEVKFRLMYTANQLNSEYGEMALSALEQGAGRLWAPTAILATLPDGAANGNMDLTADLAHGWATPTDLAFHYGGPVMKLLSDDGSAYLYYIDNGNGTAVTMGVADAVSNEWLTSSEIQQRLTFGSSTDLIWAGGNMVWAGGNMVWAGGELFNGSGTMVWAGGILVMVDNQIFDSNGNLIWDSGDLFDASGNLIWAGGNMVWAGGNMVWAGGNMVWAGSQLFNASGTMVWAGGNMVWAGGKLFDDAGNLVWPGGQLFDASGNMVWAGGNMVWAGGNMVWAGGNMVWAGGNMVWAGGNMVWAGSNMVWAGSNMVWAGGNMVWAGSTMAPDSTLAPDIPLAADSNNMVWFVQNMAWNSGIDWAVGNTAWTGNRVDWDTGNLGWDETWTDGIDVDETDLLVDNWVYDDNTTNIFDPYELFVPIVIK